MRFNDALLRFSLFLFFIITGTVKQLKAQDYATEKSLVQQLRSANSDSEKVYCLYDLINFYYAFNFEKKADSLREIQIITAQESGNQSLIQGVLFPVYYNYITQNSSTRRFQKELDFADQALEYAKSVNKNELVALAYSTMAAVYRNSGKPDLALKNAEIAFTTAISSGNDSVKIITALEWGDVFMQKKDLLMAYRKFSNADDIANNLRNPYLLSAVYNHFSLLYVKLGKIEKAKEYLLNSIALNAKAGNTKGLVKDYITISTKILDFVPAKTYLQRAALIADSLHDPVLMLQINYIQFVQYMINDNSENTFKFLKLHPDVEMSIHGLGQFNYEWVTGEIFLYSNKYDSAIVHLKKAEPFYNENFNISGRINFLSELAACYRGLKLYHEAINYYTTTLLLTNGTLNTREKNNCLDALHQLYYETGDFKKAYEYELGFNLFKDSVNNLNKDRELVFLEIDTKNNRIQKENELAIQALERKHNAQYMLITITVAAVFLLLVLLGLFTVSTTTIRVLGFFSFIFLFEFITLLLDNWVHDKTHGEPWKIWLFKIFIISLLFPLHHWMEHKLIQYLLSRKLIHTGSLFSFKKLFGQHKKQTAPVEIITEAVEPNMEIKPEL